MLLLLWQLWILETWFMIVCMIGREDHSSAARTYVGVACYVCQVLTEVIVSHILWMNIVDSFVNIQTCLDVVFEDSCLLQLTDCFLCTENQWLVSRRHPTPLNVCPLLFISSIMFVLSDHCCWYLYCFFRILIELTGKILVVFVLKSVIRIQILQFIRRIVVEMFFILMIVWNFLSKILIINCFIYILHGRMII